MARTIDIIVRRRYMKILFISLETTGLDIVKDSIIRVSGKIYDYEKEKELHKFSISLKPYKEVKRLTTELEEKIGISNLDISTFLPNDIAFLRFKDTLLSYDTDYILVGNSNSFVLSFLREWFLFNNCDLFKSLFPKDIDILNVSKSLILKETQGVPLRRYTLGNIYSFLLKEELTLKGVFSKVDAIYKLYDFIIHNM